MALSRRLIMVRDSWRRNVPNNPLTWLREMTTERPPIGNHFCASRQ